MVTMTDVKKAIGDNGDGRDGEITTLIPYIYEELENYVGWTDLTVIKMIEYHLNHKTGLASESLSRHSLSFEIDYPRAITKSLRRKL